MTTEFGSDNYSPTGQEYIWDANTQAFVATGPWNGGSQVAPLGWTGLSNNAGAYESTLLNWNYFERPSPTPDSLFVPSNPFAPNTALAPNLPAYSYSASLCNSCNSLAFTWDGIQRGYYGCSFSSWSFK